MDLGTEKNDELQVGVITQTHGIRGEVKVFPTKPENLSSSLGLIVVGVS